MSGIDTSRLLAMRSQILGQNAALQKAAGMSAPALPGAAEPGAVKPGFGDALRSALRQVNELQDKAGSVSAAYERGETTDIAAVMLAREKSSIAFQATLQVRNKLLSAYKDIMSMPV